MDKNKAVIDYLLTCPSIQDTPLYFNFINAKNDHTQFITVSNDTVINRLFIDGSIAKRYDFTIIVFKSISNNPISKNVVYSDENVVDMSDVQTIIDWIETQNENRVFPNFGNNCIIDSISTTTTNPNLNSIDTTVTPALARYSITIRIEYVDYTKSIYNL